MPEQLPEPPLYNRRDFLRAALGVPVGVATGLASVAGLSRVEEALQERGVRTGNVNIIKEQQEFCGQAVPDADCQARYGQQTKTRIAAGVVAPTLEEAVFRGFPSIIVDKESGKSWKEALHNVAVGSNESRFLSRREAVAGAISSIIFGYIHNARGTSFDMGRVPVSQTVGGGIMWLLQRRLGIASNMSMHATWNWTAVLGSSRRK
jgi:hypothetical protein